MICSPSIRRGKGRVLAKNVHVLLSVCLQQSKMKDKTLLPLFFSSSENCSITLTDYYKAKKLNPFWRWLLERHLRNIGMASLVS